MYVGRGFANGVDFQTARIEQFFTRDHRDRNRHLLHVFGTASRRNHNLFQCKGFLRPDHLGRWQASSCDEYSESKGSFLRTDQLHGWPPLLYVGFAHNKIKAGQMLDARPIFVNTDDKNSRQVGVG